MKYILCIGIIFSLSITSFASDASNHDQHESEDTNNTVVWTSGVDVETFWANYAASKGGLTWGKSKTYPEYEKVKEGDTFMVLLEQGPCLMEFFHNRWRRANDVRRWDESINVYGGCPYVFD
ncbi:hypothetical protein [Marinicella sp. W31]|uniref:hypothetical protein n=1 Tax=Marinicella sp. W31 TaxID=3023713 RepID=UPI003757B0C7